LKMALKKEAQDVTRKYIIDTVVNEEKKEIENPLDLHKGDVVRWRNKGMLLKQRYGKVIKITSKWIFIEWDTAEKKNTITKFPANDLALVFKYLSKVEA